MADNEKLKVKLLDMKVEYVYKYNYFKLNKKEMGELIECQKKVMFFLKISNEDRKLSEEELEEYEKINDTLETLVNIKRAI